MKKDLKCSIITVVRNNKDTIKDAIESVLSQDYSDIEYIVVDGKSTDGTVDIIKNYGKKIDKFISEPDKGLWDAMNKGISMSTGDIVGILNSDDIYTDNKVITKVVNTFEQKNVDCCFADIEFVSGDNLDRVIRYYDSSKCFPEKFKYGLYPAHPSFFVMKKFYDQYGLYNINYITAADFDLLTRFLYVQKLSYAYINEPIVKMRLGGVSTTFKGMIINTHEQFKVCRRNGIKTNIINILLKYPVKLLGVINK
jgi:glycosyltransferase involved in cell wall biosynthesis